MKVLGFELLSVLVRSALEKIQAQPSNTLSIPSLSEGAPNSAPAGRSAEQEGAAVSRFDDGVVGTIAEKVLLAWLRNRYQLLYPFLLDLRRLNKEQVDLLIHAMIAAAEADGSLEAKEHMRISGALKLIKPDAGETAYLDDLLHRPKPLSEILPQVRDLQTAALVYAASLMAIDERKAVNKLYLRYLAARLQLSDELSASLEQRYRAAD